VNLFETVGRWTRPSSLQGCTCGAFQKDSPT
jgi:hypothetical protein